MSNYYRGGVGFGIGQMPNGGPMTLTSEDLAAQQRAMDSGGQKTIGTLMALAGTVAVPVLAYHGYKRNNSVGWALVWGLFGSVVWPITVPIAFAQGYGKKKVAANRRRRRTSRRPRPRRRTSRRRR